MKVIKLRFESLNTKKLIKLLLSKPGSDISNKNKNYKKLICIKFILLILFSIYFFLDENPKITKLIHIDYEKYEKIFNGNSTCDLLDPINYFKQRIKEGKFEICNDNNTKHICYINVNPYINRMAWGKNFVFCTMENIILDPLKSNQSGLVFRGHVDPVNLGYPILSKGFLNTKCNHQKITFPYNHYLAHYFNSWNYDYNNENVKLEELSPGKTIFLMSRNQDSPNLYHGNCEVMNAISMLYLFKLYPEDIQIVFMESIGLPDDPFYDIYKYMISFGTEPIYIKNLTKKYKISKAIHVPNIFDSPIFIHSDYPKCNSTTKTFQLYNDFVDKYMNLTPFKDQFININNSFYYPKKIINNYFLNKKFKKIVTIQWRRLWPEGRKGQPRIFQNAPQLADKLASVLPDDILIRVIDNAKLPYKDQIALARSSDYFVGIHGAGLSLVLFMPQKSIFHEILSYKNNKLLLIMSSMSGHKTYSDIIKANSNKNDGNENIIFDENDFVDSVLKHMKENNFLQ